MGKMYNVKINVKYFGSTIALLSYRAVVTDEGSCAPEIIYIDLNVFI